MVLQQEKPTDPVGVQLEAWSQGFLVGALVVMACVTVINMRKRILLHKLILIELLLGMPVGTFMFIPTPAYHWYLSTTAIFLYMSWTLHNIIAWMKNKPFLSRRASLFYILTVAAVQPYWIFELVANYLYFAGRSDMFRHSRPLEPLFKDPWWVFTVCSLFWNIKTKYELGYTELIRVSPRFGILLGAMALSLCFVLLDVLSVTGVMPTNSLPDGINPYWKFAYIFKSLTDTIILDDFKTALDKLTQYKIDSRLSSLFSDPADVIKAKRGDRRNSLPMYSSSLPASSFQDSSASHTIKDWNDFKDP